jgi:c-di-GMP-binding flagellar brake protein YcgR
MTQDPHPHRPATVHQLDRRQNPRIGVKVPLKARLGEGDVVTLLNISEGGFLMCGPTDFPDHAIWEFRFELPDAGTLTMRGRIVHSMRTTMAGTKAYVVGVEFIDDGSETHQANVQRLIRIAHAEHD